MAGTLKYKKLKVAIKINDKIKITSIKTLLFFILLKKFIIITPLYFYLFISINGFFFKSFVKTC